MTEFAEVALHDAFRAVLNALSRPGSECVVPGAIDAVGAARLVLDSVWENDAPPIVITGEVEPGELLEVPTGTEAEPELGGTVVIIADESAATTTVRLAGPGIAELVDTTLPLSARALSERGEACARAPRGIDLVVIGPGPIVRGLPRTTSVEEVP